MAFRWNTNFTFFDPIKTMLASHSKAGYFLMLARFIERAMYYGVRAIIVIFAMSAYNVSRAEALSWYGFFTGLVYLSQFLGGILTDLLLKSKISILAGGILQIIGVLLFIIPDYEVYKAAGILFSIGSGLYSVNIASIFGRLYTGKSECLASGYTLFYMLINAGAFLGVLLLPMLVLKWSHSIAFSIIAGLLTISTLFSFFFTNSKIPEVKRVLSAPKGKGVLLIILSIIATSVFWTSFEIVGGFITVKSMEVNEAFNGAVDPYFTLDVNSYTVMITGVLLFLIWSYSYISNILKIGIAMALAGIAHYTMLIQLESLDSLYQLLLFHTIILAIAEMLIIPATLSIFASYSHPKYLTLIYGSAVFAGALLLRLQSDYSWELIDYPEKITFKITAYTLLGVGAVFLLLNQFLKDKSPYELIRETTEKEPDLKEGDLLD